MHNLGVSRCKNVTTDRERQKLGYAKTKTSNRMVLLPERTWENVFFFLLPEKMIHYFLMLEHQINFIFIIYNYI